MTRPAASPTTSIADAVIVVHGGEGVGSCRWEEQERFMSHRLATFSVAFLLWALSGCSQLTVRAGGGESDVASVVPGMTRDQVVARLGQPTWTFGVWQEHLTILNYRFR